MGGSGSGRVLERAEDGETAACLLINEELAVLTVPSVFEAPGLAGVGDGDGGGGAAGSSGASALTDALGISSAGI